MTSSLPGHDSILPIFPASNFQGLLSSFSLLIFFLNHYQDQSVLGTRNEGTISPIWGSVRSSRPKLSE